MPKFGWKAIYEDCVIRQYQFGKPETNYSEVVTRGLPEKFFVGSRYGVNLRTGEFLIKGVWQRIGNADTESLKPQALVYFRRNIATMNAEFIQERKVFHFVGYEYQVLPYPNFAFVRLCIPDDNSASTICVGRKEC